MGAEGMRITLDRLRILRDSLGPFIEELAVKLPPTALSDVEGRITEEGIDAHGNPLPPYSPGYLAYKKKKGRYTGKTDLRFTDRMWRNTNIDAEETTDDGFVVTIRPRSEENQKKMDANAERYHIDPLEMSSTEQVELALDLDGLLQRHVDLIMGK